MRPNPSARAESRLSAKHAQLFRQIRRLGAAADREELYEAMDAGKVPS